MIDRALTIAGSDSGGVCGVQADLKTFAALSVYGTSAVAAITCQNTKTMTRVLPTPPDVLAEQIELVLSDIGTDAVKIGMLGGPENYEAVEQKLRKHGAGNVVVDPVITCYRGCAFVLEDEQLAQLRNRLLPLTRVFALAIPEAEVLLRRSVRTVEEMREAAERLAGWGSDLVVIKGGHLEGDDCIDVIYDGSDFAELAARRIDNRNDNGSGCTFSSAVAAYLAKGKQPVEAISAAKRYLEQALRNAFPIGEGAGPVHHFYKHWPPAHERRSAGA